MSEQDTTFLERCLAGEAFLDEIDEYVDHWHDGGGFGTSLPQFLGMTFEEYALWVEKPAFLNAIVFARKFGYDIAHMPIWANGYALAARGASPEETGQLIEWLKKTGRLPA